MFPADASDGRRRVLQQQRIEMRQMATPLAHALHLRARHSHGSRALKTFIINRHTQSSGILAMQLHARVAGMPT